MRRLLSRRAVVLLALLASLVLAATSRATWTTAKAAGFTGTQESVAVTGQDAAPAVLALALVGAAAAVATTLAARWVRFVAGPVLVLVGVGAAVSALGVSTDTVAASRSAVAEKTGVVGGSISAGATSWPLLAVIPAALLIATGLAVLLVGGRWPRRPSRYQRDAARSRVARETDPSEDPAAAWDALSRGEDPSSGGPPRVAE
ncbi:hypothetical protein DEO23_11380 [Brachybacterium endophyticum]|uniref:TIGR02234 family membrane protein n=1 Tax=Brachybacterium endophyticum TaxID=2182385 RepID=A0A2U2RIW0_9MICO|nr:Trp biosynthesis-associated membrane protein [Brachybacterium endophyticum]PWH05796.1 hypothetical protein DEO23_11380 [Brachybacterium endophyticum]